MQFCVAEAVYSPERDPAARSPPRDWPPAGRRADLDQRPLGPLAMDGLGVAWVPAHGAWRRW
jgi:hypothetical protein